MNIQFNKFETLDDIMNDVLTDLLNLPFNIKSTRGTSSEIIGMSICLTNPLARLSRSETKGKIFSALGECLWYLSGRNDLDHIVHYIKKYSKESEDNLTVYGGYGPRLYNFRDKYNQIENVINTLKLKPTSRKAVIQLFDAVDLHEGHSEFPCTCTLQFFVRDGKLNMYTSMRSNDAMLGLPHDIFAFTMIQEIIALNLNVNLGEYYHSVGSMHLYETDINNAKDYLNEGFQSTVSIMPNMPQGNPTQAIKILLDEEKKIRTEKDYMKFLEIEIDSYWKDLMKLLKIFSMVQNKDFESIELVRKDMNPIYETYINKKLR